MGYMVDVEYDADYTISSDKRNLDRQSSRGIGTPSLCAQ